MSQKCRCVTVFKKAKDKTTRDKTQEEWIWLINFYSHVMVLNMVFKYRTTVCLSLPSLSTEPPFYTPAVGFVLAYTDNMLTS